MKMISATWSHTRLLSYYVLVVGWDSSVRKVIVYWLNGPGIESRWEHDFPLPSRLAVGPILPPVRSLPGLFPLVKAVGRAVDNTPPSSAEVKKE